MSFICYFLSDDKHQSKNSICMFIQKKIFIQFFFSYSSNILKSWKRLTLAEVNLKKKKKIKDPTAHDIPRYFPQLLVTLQFWLCPRNHNPQLQLLLDMWKKHMLKQLTKLWRLHFSPDCQSLRFFSMWFYRNQNNDHKSSWPHLSLPSALLWKHVKKKSKAGENSFSID